jgi:NitT/TauT family transport system substrate-binding protein
MNRWRETIRFPFLACLLILVAGPGCRCQGSGAGREKVRVAFLPTIACLPAMVASDSGAFGRHGLDVELVRFTTSNDAMNAVVSGKADVYFLASSSLPLAFEQRRPGLTKSFMVNVNTAQNPLDYLIVPAASTVGALSELAGKTIGVFPGTTMKGFLLAALKSQGVAPDSVKVVELAPPAQLTALMSGDVDALLALEPVPTQAVTSGKAKVLVAGLVERYVLDPWIGGTATVLATYAAAHRDALNRFQTAIADILPTLAAPTPENLAILEKYSGIPRDVAQKVGFVRWVQLHDIPRDEFQKLSDRLFDVKALDTKVDTKGFFLDE